MKKRLEDRLPSRSRSLVSLLLALALAATQTPRGLAAPPPQAAAQRPIVVQAGAFRGPTASGVLVAQLEEKGFSPTVVPGDDYYRVVLGPFANDAEANTALSKLKGEGFDGYIRRDLVLPAQSAVASPRTEAPTRQTPPQPAPPPAQAPAQTPAEPPAQPTRPPAGQATPLPLIRVEPSRPPTAPTPPEPAPPATPEQPVTTAQPPAQPPPVPRPGVPTRPVEPQPPEPAATPSAVAAAEPAPAPPARPEARVSAPSTVSAPPVSVPQAGALPTVGQARGASSLKILVMEGEGAINNTRQRTARDPVIQVVDENDRPIGGVAVTFALPSRGASGVFANGARSMTILTDAQGMATATGLTPNTVAGDLAIQVSASHQGQTASAMIAQTNVAAGAGMSAATIGIIGAIAAGAAVGAVIAFKGGDKPIIEPPVTTPTGTATVRPGDVVISVP